MNLREAGIRAADFVLGKRVVGEIAAVQGEEVSDEEVRFQRFVVRDKDNNYLQVRIPQAYSANFGVTPAVGLPNPQYSRGQQVDLRASSVKPWVDGSR